MPLKENNQLCSVNDPLIRFKSGHITPHTPKCFIPGMVIGALNLFLCFGVRTRISILC